MQFIVIKNEKTIFLEAGTRKCLLELILVKIVT